MTDIYDKPVVTVEEPDYKYKCDLCGKHCKDKRGLGIHSANCKHTQLFNCTYCNTQLKTYKNLNNHYITCVEYRIHQIQLKYNADTDKLKSDYEAKINDLRQQHINETSKLESEFEFKMSIEKREHNQQLHFAEQRCDNILKMSSDDMRRIQEERDQLQEDKKQQQKRIQDLESKINQLERKNDLYIQAYIKKDQSQQGEAKTVIQYTNNNHTNNNIHLQHFDPSCFSDKIRPPEVMIRNVDQLIDLLNSNGFRNFYRVTDRSRKSLLWYDQQGKEIRDTNGSQIASTILQVLEPSITSQISYLEKQVEHYRSLPNQEEYIDKLQENYETINFCKSLLAPFGKRVLSKITKGISDIAKNTNDTTLDQPKKNPGFTNVCQSIRALLFPSVSDWINLSPEAFGSYLYSKSPTLFHIEPSFETTRTIFIKNDTEQRKPMSSEQIGDMIHDVITSTLCEDCKDIVINLVEETTSYNDIHTPAFVEWILVPNNTFSESILTGMYNRYRHN